jgi:Zn-dependent protease
MIPVADVEAELSRPDRGRRSSVQSALLLVASVGVFAATRLLNASWTSVAIVVVVLFIHESGHWLGMRLFGYRDLQMFFIPFFGAAVSGKDVRASGVQRAFVALLGPVPGIFIGIACGFIYLRWREPLLLSYGITSVLINGLNLLPIYPLDGGRFMEAVIFSRHPVVEVAFKVLAAVALVILALRLSSIPLGFLAFMTLVLAREAYYQGEITARLRDITGGDAATAADRIPPEYLEAILPELSLGLPASRLTAKGLANRADAVWRRFSQRAPAFWPSAALLALYAGVFVLGIGGTTAFLAANRALAETAAIVQRYTFDGRVVMVEERHWKQVKTFEAQLASGGLLYDGPSTAWTTAGIKSQQGAWRNGFRQGEWWSFDSSGAILSVVTYEDGRPVGYKAPRDGVLTVIGPDDWPFAVRHGVQTTLQGPHYRPQAK